MRLHVVTGKGGTGKTTVAAALALALAADGGSVLLVETEGRQGIAQIFDTPPLPYEERRVAVARGGGEVKALAIDVEEALLDYLDMFYNLRRAGRALRKMGAIDFATAIAPGLRDVLLTGKIKEAVTRRHDGRPVYDAVVVDAPPTGRITRFLGVTAEMAQLASSGPIKTQSDGVMAVLRSPQTAVHLVTLLEDMPVQETADAIAELTKAAAAGRLGDRQHGDRAGAARDDAGPAPRRAGSPAPSSRRRWPPPTCPAATRSPTRWPPRSPSTPAAGRPRTRCGTTSRRWAARRSSCRC